MLVVIPRCPTKRQMANVNYDKVIKEHIAGSKIAFCTKSYKIVSRKNNSFIFWSILNLRWRKDTSVI